MCRYTSFARCTVDCLGTGGYLKRTLYCSGSSEHFVLSQSMLSFVFCHLTIFDGITVRVVLSCTVFYSAELY